MDTTPPVIDSILFEGSVIQDTQLVGYETPTINIIAHDPDTTIKVYLNGAEVDPTNGQYNVQVTPKHSFDSLDTVRVVNAAGLETVEYIRMVLNRKPYIKPLSAQIYYINESKSDSLPVSDADGDSLKFTAVVTHGDGSVDTLSITDEGIFTYTPLEVDTGGRAKIVFTISDGYESVSLTYVPNVSLRDVPRIDSIKVNGARMQDMIIVDTAEVEVHIYSHDPDTTIAAVYINQTEVSENDGVYAAVIEPDHSLEDYDTIRVINAFGREAKKIVRIVRNATPRIREIEITDSYSGEIAGGVLSVVDDDEDALTITGTVTHGDKSTEPLTISGSDFSWTPNNSDTAGRASISFTVSDGFSSIDTTYTPVVKIRPMLRITTTPDDVRDTVMLGTDPLEFILESEVYPETTTVSYTASASNLLLSVDDNKVVWSPTVAGNYTIRCTARGTNGLEDEISIPVTVIRMPQPVIKSITIDGQPLPEGDGFFHTRERHVELVVNTSTNFGGHTVAANAQPSETTLDSVFAITVELDHGRNEVTVNLMLDGNLVDDTVFAVTSNILPVFKGLSPDIASTGIVEAENPLSVNISTYDANGDDLIFRVSYTVGDDIFRSLTIQDSTFVLNFPSDYIGERVDLKVEISDRYTENMIDTTFELQIVDESSIGFITKERDIADSLILNQESMELQLATESSGPYEKTYWVTRHNVGTGVQDTLLAPDTSSRFTWSPTAATDTGWNDLVFYVRSGRAMDKLETEVYVEPLTVEFLEDTSYAGPIADNHLVHTKLVFDNYPYFEMDYRVLETTTASGAAFDANDPKIRYEASPKRAAAYIYIANYSNSQIGKTIEIQITGIVDGGIRLGKRTKHTIILGQAPQDQPR